MVSSDIAIWFDTLNNVRNGKSVYMHIAEMLKSYVSVNEHAQVTDLR